MTHESMPDKVPAGSQTLSRGLRALELLAQAERPLAINDLAKELGVHRSNAYRVLRTLEEHRLVLRNNDGRIRLGPRLTVLARGVAPGLNTAAAKPMAELANRVGMTAFLTLLDADEVITVHSAEPTNVDVAVARRPGTRHSVLIGAPGHAIESLLSDEMRAELFGSPVKSDAAVETIKRGYAVSENEVISGVSAIAVPLSIAGEPPAALALAHFSQLEHPEDLAGELRAAAARITQSHH